MPFDIIGARQAGYSDREIADELAKSSKFDAGSARKAGYNDQEILGHLLSETDIGNKATHWYDPSVDFAKDIASAVVDAPLVPVKMGRGLVKAANSAINWATEPSEYSTPEQTENAQVIRENLTSGTELYDQAEEYWKPKIASAQQSLATPDRVDLLGKINKVAATGIGSAMKLAPALPFGVGGMATTGAFEKYDETGDVGKALIEAAKSAVVMKTMGVTHWMDSLKAVATVSGISGADTFVSTLAETGSVEESVKAAGMSMVQMAAMDIANRGMMPTGTNAAVSRDLYKRMVKNGTQTEVAADLAGRFNPDIQPSDKFYAGNALVPVDKVKQDYAETLGDLDGLIARGYSLKDIARMSPDLFDQVNVRNGFGSAAPKADPSVDPIDLTADKPTEPSTVSGDLDALQNPTESAINVNAAPQPQGNILEEMLNGPPAAEPVAPEPAPPAEVPSVQPEPEASTPATPDHPLTPAALDQEIAHTTSLLQSSTAAELSFNSKVANGEMSPEEAKPLIADASARTKAATSALKILGSQKQAATEGDQSAVTNTVPEVQVAPDGSGSVVPADVVVAATQDGTHVDANNVATQEEVTYSHVAKDPRNGKWFTADMTDTPDAAVKHFEDRISVLDALLKCLES